MWTNLLFFYYADNLNPIQSGLFLTANDQGGAALKVPPPPPYTISKTIVSIFTISYMCILPGVLGMFQLEFRPFYSDFKIKSRENSCIIFYTNFV